MKDIAVVSADNLASLQTFRKIKDLDIADFILEGPKDEIDSLAKENNIHISDFEFADKRREKEIAIFAADLVKMHITYIYYKGSLNPITVLKAIFEDELFLKKIVSGLSIMDIPKLG